MCERRSLLVALPNSVARETRDEVAIPISELPRSRADGLTCMISPALSGRAGLVLGLCFACHTTRMCRSEPNRGASRGLSWNPAGKAQEDEPVEAATDAMVV